MTNWAEITNIVYCLICIVGMCRLTIFDRFNECLVDVFDLEEENNEIQSFNQPTNNYRTRQASNHQTQTLRKLLLSTLPKKLSINLRRSFIPFFQKIVSNLNIIITILYYSLGILKLQKISWDYIYLNKHLLNSGFIMVDQFFVNYKRRDFFM